MKRWLTVIVLLASVLLLGASGNVGLAHSPNDVPEFAPDRILVKFLPQTPQAVKAAIHDRCRGRVAQIIPSLEVQVVTVPANQVMAKVKAYRAEKGVLFAEPDYVARAIFAANDPKFGQQWGLTRIQAPKAWDKTQGLPTIRIAILDTGIDQDHEDLSGKIVANQNFTGSLTVDDKNGHGTHVAGIAAAVTNNGIGVAGIGFNSSLMNVKVLGDDGSGYYSWVASGIRWAADNGAKVISLSLGGRARSSTLESAVKYAWNKGVVLVAAAGNNGSSAPIYPAYYTNCIAVAATDQNDAKASWSNFGNWVDIAAPGINILSTLPNHANTIGSQGYGFLSGTSMATPLVAGTAALVWATGYGTNASSVRNRIQNTADAAGTMWSRYRIKRVNAYNAVR